MAMGMDEITMNKKHKQKAGGKKQKEKSEERNEDGRTSKTTQIKRKAVRRPPPVPCTSSVYWPRSWPSLLVATHRYTPLSDLLSRSKSSSAPTALASRGSSPSFFHV